MSLTYSWNKLRCLWHVLGIFFLDSHEMKMKFTKWNSNAKMCNTCHNLDEMELSDPNFIRGTSFDMIFSSSLVKLCCLVPVTAQSQGSLSVLIKNTKGYQRRGQKGLLWIFLDPSSPKLAFGSPRPWNGFMAKQPARLGELITSGLRFSSPGRAPTAPKCLFLYK